MRCGENRYRGRLRQRMDATNAVAAYDLAVEFAEKRIRRIVARFVAGLECPDTCGELAYDSDSLTFETRRVWGGRSPDLPGHYRIVIDVKYRFAVTCSAEQEPVEEEEEQPPVEEEGSETGSGSGTTPGGGTTPPPTPGNCTEAQEAAELQQMLALYSAEVTDRRAQGYQAGNDAGYSDPGLGFHAVGNCADWQQVSWSSLVTRTWNCWRIQKIRARRHWTPFTFHHFVRLTAVGSGRIVYLDPWKSGNPDQFENADFEFRDGHGWAHTETHTHQPGDSPRDPGND